MMGSNVAEKIHGQERIDILRDLAENKSIHHVADEFGYEDGDILAVAKWHGYPDRAALGDAANLLEQSLSRKASLDEGTERLTVQRQDTMAAIAQEDNPVLPVNGFTPKEPVVQEDRDLLDDLADADVDWLVGQGKKSTSKATRVLAERVAKQVATLRTAVKEEREKIQADAKAAAIAAQAASRLAVLQAEEKQLLALLGKKKATDGRRSGGTGTPAGVEPADVRAWAKANGVPINGRGAIPKKVLTQYLASLPQGQA